MSTFADTSDAVLLDPVTQAPVVGAHCTVWTADPTTGTGTQITAITAPDGTSLPGYVTSDVDGRIPYKTVDEFRNTFLQDPSGNVYRFRSKEAYDTTDDYLDQFPGVSSASAQASTDAATAKTNAATALTQVTAIAPDGGARAVGKDEILTSATDHGVVAGATDNSLALQSILTNLQPGQEFKIPAGDYSFAATLTIPVSDVTIRLAKGANLTHTGIGKDAIIVTGDRVTVKGAGLITSPANFDSTTGSTSHYAVIHVKGNDCKVNSVRLNNVQNVGVYFDETNRIQMYGVQITGNFPMASYTGTNTTHMGIAFNAGASGITSAGVVMGCIVDSCVQGLFIGNYGTRGSQTGTTITGNTFSNCHNHGIYHDDPANQCAVTGNAFTECQLCIVMIGPNHTVTGNVITTAGLNNNDERVGINMRNAIGCTVNDNTIKGYSAGSIVINFTQTNGGTTISGNVVNGNTIDIADAGVLIQFGTGTTTVLTDNVAVGNVLKGQGSSTTGVVAYTASSSATATYGNKLNSNLVVIRGATNGIWASRIKHLTVQNNTVRLEYNASATTSIACVLLADGCSNCKVSGNDYMNTPGYGANVNLRGTAESGAVSGNKVVQNSHDQATGTLTYIPFLPVVGSEAFLDESGPGVPNRQCCVGSRWSQTDGAAGSAFYIKTSNSTTSTNWVAVA